MDKRRKYAAITLIICLILVAIIVAYAQLESQYLGIDVVGQTLVDSEFPSPAISPLYLKPVTWLIIIIIVAWFSFIEIIKNRIRSETGFARSVISLALVLAIILSAYEVMYNFLIWGVMMIREEDDASFHPDKMVNAFPSEKYQINLVFATKGFITILGCAVYGFYMLREDKGSRN